MTVNKEDWSSSSMTVNKADRSSSSMTVNKADSQSGSRTGSVPTQPIQLRRFHEHAPNSAQIVKFLILIFYRGNLLLLLILFTPFIIRSCWHSALAGEDGRRERIGILLLRLRRLLSLSSVSWCGKASEAVTAWTSYLFLQSPIWIPVGILILLFLAAAGFFTASIFGLIALPVRVRPQIAETDSDLQEVQDEIPELIEAESVTAMKEKV